MMGIQEVELGAHAIERFIPASGDGSVARAQEIGAAARERLRGRAVWNVNSTAAGGGVAELLHSLMPYVRGFGIDARWIVIGGPPEFFHITKRLHHALHGSRGDGSDLSAAAQADYERVSQTNADELSALVRPHDVVILHDPQTAGLAPPLSKLGAIVIWRCHIGADAPDEETARGWNFLAPYICEVAATVFTRRQYVPAGICNHDRSSIIAPSIDPFSPKNQHLDEGVVAAILAHTGVIEGASGDVLPTFVRTNGSPGRVDRRADIVRHGPAPSPSTPLVVQVSRWDPLKDPLGVLLGFARYVEREPRSKARLVLAGPNVQAIEDDPESAKTLNDVSDRWRALPHALRERVDLVSLPTADLEENGAIVNALQRHAAVVVQKSLHEGFGLTVTEAMWKGRPVVASAVGGIQDQIVDGVHGLLLDDPTDLESFASLVGMALSDSTLATELGQNARERVRMEYLPIRHLSQYAELLERVDT